MVNSPAGTWTIGIGVGVKVGVGGLGVGVRIGVGDLGVGVRVGVRVRVGVAVAGRRVGVGVEALTVADAWARAVAVALAARAVRVAATATVGVGVDVRRVPKITTPTAAPVNDNRAIATIIHPGGILDGAIFSPICVLSTLAKVMNSSGKVAFSVSEDILGLKAALLRHRLLPKPS
ncbi:MAG: hypothetical protein ACETWR_10705 [Anaerolineae bacterium]